MGFTSPPSRIVEMPEEDEMWFLPEKETEETERKEEEVPVGV